MGKPSNYIFDQEAADRVCRFFEKRLRHFEGKFAGKPFTLLPWQRQMLRDVFGWKRQDGTRRYRHVYCEVARKNGKSLLCAGLAIYLLYADNEPGAQVYSVACNTQQANITFGAARKMVDASPELKCKIQQKQYHLAHASSRSIYKALSGENVGAHGKNIHGLIIDELHEWEGQSSRELYEALVTSMGSRAQPLTVAITTAGHGGEQTLCRELHDKALRYLAGEVKPGDEAFDDTFYAVVYAAGKDDPWDDPQTWAKANPSLGETVQIDYLRKECVKAKESPAYENTFKRLFLNIWTEQATRWLSLGAWDACCREIEPAEVAGKPCVVGLDLSASYDLTAVVAVYMLDEHWLIVPKLYCPRATAAQRSKEDDVPYLEWVQNGHVSATDGPTIDYDRVEADLLDLRDTADIQAVAFDPYNATSIVNHLENAGLVTVPVHQTFLGMSAASKELERRLINKSVVIAENPAFRWMAANVEVEQDRHGNIRPVKPRAGGKYAGTGKYKIDGIVAMVIAITRAMLLNEGENSGSAATEIIFL